ncbi:MAG TPA: Gfo/Idh/MocA family oxidoreductase [Opitutus sp.]|nr:Gfo/Idh/MocA family oxidoreductase [Opitutus sp.]
MNNSNLSRRTFLKTSALAGAGLSLAGSGLGATGAASAGAGAGLAELGRIRPRPAGQKPVHQLTTAPLKRVRVGVIGLHRGLAHVNAALGVEFADVVAVCDVREDRTNAAAEHCVKVRGRRPATYSGTEHVWEKLVGRDDVDVVYIATPWAWHVPMGLRAMEQGKHAFIEVAAAITVDDCWRLVDTSERTQRHCVMLENCCYGENELFVLNLARAGVFGTLTHAECGYIHDLREVLFQLGSEGDWRRDYHEKMDGNLYPTHGLGPVAQYLGVGRGDRFKFLVSTSSLEASLTEHRNEAQPNGGRHAAEKYICGDMNTSILKTERGRTIMLQHDVVSPRPYSRINALCGTRATFFDYPARLALDQPALHGLEAKGSEEWLNEKDLAKMREKFTHPLWRQLAARAAGSGHGGMDFVMNYRHLDCLHRGLTPDSVVYDAAAWSCIIELSSRSVAAGSAPMDFPDFTRGLWKAMEPLGIVEAEPQRA